MVMRLTPNGRSVSRLVSAISTESRSGVMDPEAITPNPPPLEMAETRWRSDTQVMAPPMIARLQPRKRQPRCQSFSRCASAARCRVMSLLSVKAVGGVQAAYGELGVLLGDQHADLDLRGGDHLDVDSLLGQGVEHALGDAGMAAHADADDRDLDDIGVGLQMLEFQRLVALLQDAHGPLEVGLGDGEGDVGVFAAARDVLDDHVHVDIG